MNTETNKDDALELLQDNHGADLVSYPLSKDIGSVKNKERELIEKISNSEK